MLDRSEAAVVAVRGFFAGYFWIILKNVIGWLLILLSFPVGITLPGPGGLPIFLLGFALVFFPGKRKLTSHVLRGRPLRIEASIFTSITTVVSLLVVGVLLWFAGDRYQQLMAYFRLDPEKSMPGFVAALIGVCVFAALVTFGVMRLTLRFVNRLIRVVPRIRRFIRPLMRRWGIVLLPPPKKASSEHPTTLREQIEIIELSASSRERFVRIWAIVWPWTSRLLKLLFLAMMVFFCVAPVVEHWRNIEPLINQLRPIEFLAAVSIFVGFLLAFRVMSWWMILRDAKLSIPYICATRVWCTTELARYLPNAGGQLVERGTMLEPYNISPADGRSSQTIEVILFGMANVLVAGGCVIWYAADRTTGDGKWWWLALAIVLTPLVMTSHPRAFHSVASRITKVLGRPELTLRPRGRTTMALLGWNVIGLIVVSLAIWLLVSGPLGLGFGDWWIGAAAYFIAWCVGALIPWTPSGLGVREFVFATMLLALLPPGVKTSFDHDGLVGFVFLLAMVLRVWTISGELILTLVAYALDLEGAMGRK